jgi:hypothetical protein
VGGPSTISQFALAISKWWLSSFIASDGLRTSSRVDQSEASAVVCTKGMGWTLLSRPSGLKRPKCVPGDPLLNRRQRSVVAPEYVVLILAQQGDLTPSEASHSIRLPNRACGTVHTSEPVWARGSHFVASASSSFKLTACMHGANAKIMAQRKASRSRCRERGQLLKRLAFR